MRPNPFESVDIDSISNAINNFINSLNNVNYSSSGCFAMSTNAKYDGTFNAGIEYLKGKDIASMIALCNSCNSNIIAKIKHYNNYYNTIYKPRYSRWNNAREKITINNVEIDNPDKLEYKKDLDEATKYLIDLKNEINGASF